MPNDLKAAAYDAAFDAWDWTEARKAAGPGHNPECLEMSFCAGFDAAWDRRAELSVTAQILDLIQSGLEVAGVGEVIIDEDMARAFLAEHRGRKSVTG